MKIEVAKPDLEAALSVVAVATASSGSDGRNLSGHYVFRYTAKTDTVEVFGSNIRSLGCSMPLAGCQCTAEEDVAGTVEAWRLSKWLSAVQDAVLTLEWSDGRVRATGPKGSVSFSSLDPEEFPFWDSTLEASGESVLINAKRLHSALSHTRLFISDKETTTPKLAVTEMKDGSLRSTDKGALAVVSLQGLEKSTIRIHGKNLGQVLNFVGSCDDESIGIREHEKSLFLVREDGGVMTISRPNHAFPDVPFPPNEDPHRFTLRADDLKSAIGALAASASKEDTRITVRLNGDMVHLSMTSHSGEVSELHLEAQEHHEGGEDAIPIPEKGFDLSYPYLIKILGQWQNDTIEFGLNPRVDNDGNARGGDVRVRDVRHGDDYLTMLVWRL
jgi:DNA polymerase III sliding clamp (beta) subunit (PCNA family)